MDQYVQLHNLCKGNTGATEEIIDKLKLGNFEGSREIQCYVKCFMSQTAMLDENGTFDSKTFIELMPPKYRPFGEKIDAACSNRKNGKDLCEIAYDLVKCFYEASPSEYLDLANADF